MHTINLEIIYGLAENGDILDLTLQAKLTG